MSAPHLKNWSLYQPVALLHEDAVCRSLVAENNANERIILHELTFSDNTPSAARMRLEYEAVGLSLLSLKRMAVPLDVDFSGNAGCLVFPWINGRTLADYISRAELTIDQVLSIADDLLDALDELHNHGHVRRVLRPDDIFIEDINGRTRAVLGGFGPLIVLQSLQNEQIARKVACYGSPEVLGALDEDIRAAGDLYSVGMILFECLTGERPFNASSTGDLVFQHMTSPVPNMISRNSRIPQALNDIVLRLLEKHPRDRYQSAAGVRFDLQQLTDLGQNRQSAHLVLGTMDRRETLIEPAFVGRSGSLNSLQSELDSVSLGNSRTVVISAASGLGKSRLLLEVSRMAALRNYHILKSVGQNQPGLAPLASLQPVIAECANIIRADSLLKTHLRRDLSGLGRELQLVVPELVAELELPVPPEGNDELSDRRIAVALATLLGAMNAGGRPVLILLDDMQWADDLTLTMLECWHLVNSRKTLLIVGTRPSDATAERLQQHLKYAEQIHLSPLVREELNQLLESMAGGLPSTILDTIWQMSAGNPFVASAVLRGLVEVGLLTASNNGWLVDEDQLRNLQMSGEAAEVLKQRLNRLSLSSQHLLAVGSVLGKEFSIEMAADVAGIARDRVLQLLIEPRKNHLIWERASDSTCSFMHDQIREAILSSMDAARRADIHFKAASCLQRTQPDRIFDIAFHFDAAGRSDLARVHALEAAEQARSSHALESAEQQYRIAFRSYEAVNEEPDFQILYGLGDVLMLSGRYQDAQPLFERAIQMADCKTKRAEVSLKLGELAFKEDRKDRAIELWEAALDSLGGKIPPAWMAPISAVREITVQLLHSVFPKQFLGTKQQNPTATDRLLWRLHSRLAYAYWFVRSKTEVLNIHLRGMNLAERYKPTAELAQAYSEHAPAMSLIPLSRRGIAYGRRSLQIRSEQNDIWGQGQSLHFLAIALYSASQFEECVDVGRRSVRILEKAGDFWEKHIAQYQVAASLYRLGRFTESAQLARDAYQSGLAVGDFQVCGNILDIWARATNGDIPPQVLKCELERPRADVQGQAHVLMAQGIHLNAEGKFDEAARVFDRGIAISRKAGISNTYTSPLYAWKATTLRLALENKSLLTRVQRRKVLNGHFKAARSAVYVALRFRNELPHALREYAWAQIFRNKNRRAVWLLRKSLQVARKQCAEFEIIQSDLLLQKLLLEMGYRRAEKGLKNAEQRHSAFRAEQMPPRMVSSLSLVDRFDSLLETGRNVAAAIHPQEICNTACEGARRLLRCTYAEIIRIDESGQPEPKAESLKHQIMSAIKTMDAVTGNSSENDLQSLIACPIAVRGRAISCLVVGNSELRDMFGPNEIRIARYIATVTGAAFENAEGFKSLQELNANLENIVRERTSVVEARSAELQQTADDLRIAQTELAAARDAAESASRAKTDFLAHMSHEIRTPIGAVLGFTELLLQGDAPLTTEQTSHLQRVLSNGNHLHRLLNDLLDLSRIEAGQLPIEPMPCAPFTLIHDIMAALQSQAIAKNLRMSVRITDRIPDRITTDPTRFRQILTNLIGNAVKFTANGSVDLFVSTETANGQLRIEVQDTGVGIAPSAQKDVFEPFKQANESVVRRFGGTGLGLSISKKLAQALGGDISLCSEPGLGSTFTLTISTGDLQGSRLLTMAEAESANQNPVPEPVPVVDLSGVQILIADDVEANREYFSHVLRRSGAVCQLVNDGQQAVKACIAKSFDLVLMDMQMPVMDGYDATAALRSHGIRHPIMAITANGTEDDKDRCSAVGCTGYLTKPISIAGLLNGIASQLKLPIDFSRKQLKSQIQQAATMPNQQLIESPVDSPPLRKTQLDPALPSDPVFRDFALRFLAKVDEALPEIKSCVENKNGKRLAELAHWIKGTGGMVGLPRLTDIGIELQTAARTADFVTAAGVVIELGRLVHRLSASQTQLPVLNSNPG